MYIVHTDAGFMQLPFGQKIAMSKYMISNDSARRTLHSSIS